MSQSLTTIRRQLALKAGGYFKGTTGVLSGSTYSGVATGGDAQKVVVSSDISDVDLAGSGSDTPGEWYDGSWLYVLETSPEQRRIAVNGYSPNLVASAVTTAGVSTLVGKLTAVRNWSATLAAGLAFEIHQYPVLDEDRKTGIHTWINRALKAMRAPTKRISIAGVTNSYRYDLSAYSAWLREEPQLQQVWNYETITNKDPWPLAGGGKLRFDGEAIYLIIETQVPTGKTFFIDVWRPLDSWIKVGSTWGDSTAGLVNESDECLGKLDQIVLVATYFMWDELVNQAISLHDDPTALIAQRDRAAAAAEPFMAFPAVQAQRGTGYSGIRGPYSDSWQFLITREGGLRRRGNYGYGGGRWR